MTESVNYLMYEEPYAIGITRIVVLTEKEAIKLQRDYMLKRTGSDVYVSDADALWDFKLLYSAWEI